MMKGYLQGDLFERRWSESGDKEPSLCRLNLGQNNDGCAPEVARTLASMLAYREGHSFLQNYPPFGVCALHERVARLHDVAPSSVLLTAGIEQAIGMIAEACLRPGDRVLVMDPTFFLFGRISARSGAVPVLVPLEESENFEFCPVSLNRFKTALKKERPKIAWLANPNNPTGLAVPQTVLDEIVRAAANCDCLLVVDEAYGEYVDPDGGVASASSFFGKYQNLVVLRTFSKAFGLAGLRIGYMLPGNHALRDKLEGYGANFPVTRLSIEAAMVSLAHLDYLGVTRRRARKRLRNLHASFSSLPDINALPTDSCIYLLRHERLDATKLRLALEARGIITAGVPGDSRASGHYVRVTLGKEAHNRLLIEGLSDLSADLDDG